MKRPCAQAFTHKLRLAVGRRRGKTVIMQIAAGLTGIVCLILSEALESEGGLQ